MSRKLKLSAAQPAPHSWPIGNWPPHVFPGDPNKARHLVRCNRTALLAAGALTRIGRVLVVIGAPYTRWLEEQAPRVDNFSIAPNRVLDAA